MPKRPKPLTDTEIRQAKQKDKQYVLYDGGGLYLLVTRTAKLWRFKYTVCGKGRLLAFGKFPDVGLSDARRKRDEAKALLAKGIDPAQAKNLQDTSFKTVALRWHGTFKSKWTEQYSNAVLRRLITYVFPIIGHLDVGSIEPPIILSMLRKIENRGTIPTAHFVKTTCLMVFRFAVGEGLCPRNPVSDLSGLLKTQATQHRSAIIEPKEFAKLLQSIDGYTGHFETRCALKLMPLLFTRTQELLNATWPEVNFDDALWIIPASRMKLRKDHAIPLCRQALSILTELKELSGDSIFIFPSIGNRKTKPLSKNTLLRALRRLDFSPEEVSVHGFRATFRTLADEILHERFDLIETQLAHTVRDTNGRAYNRTEHLEERRAMMQRWADYLDGLKQGAVVLPFRPKELSSY
jgi:integrase